MGDFALGALMGSNQSFEDTALTGWTYLTAQGSADATQVSVHSSAWSLRYAVRSSDLTEQGQRHDYFADYLLKAFPDVSTHLLIADAWGRFDTSSVGFQLQIGDTNGNSTSPFFPLAAAVHARRQVSLHTVLGVNSLLLLDAQITGTYANALVVRFYLDDVLMRVDETTLYPDYSYIQSWRRLLAQHVTYGEFLKTYLWHTYPIFSLPMEYVPNSTAELFEWWWQNQFNLALTLDTSDAETTFICRLTNDTVPLDGIHKPYGLTYRKGTLQLECINTGRLVF